MISLLRFGLPRWHRWWRTPLPMQETWDLFSILGSGRSPGGGHGNPLQYSCLENPMDRGAWWATVCGVTQRQHPRMATNVNQKQLSADLMPPYLQLAPFSCDYSAFSRLEISFHEREAWVRTEANDFCICLSSVSTSHLLNLASRGALSSCGILTLIWLSLAFFSSLDALTDGLSLTLFFCVLFVLSLLWPLVNLSFEFLGALYIFTKLSVKLCFQMVDHKINLVNYDQFSSVDQPLFFSFYYF